jgi:hypothetical protein
VSPLSCHRLGGDAASPLAESQVPRSATMGGRARSSGDDWQTLRCRYTDQAQRTPLGATHRTHVKGVVPVELRDRVESTESHASGLASSLNDWFWFWLLLNALRHRSILGAAGHIILTPANQWMVMELKIWSLSNPGSNQRPFDHWPNALTKCANRAPQKLG